MNDKRIKEITTKIAGFKAFDKTILVFKRTDGDQTGLVIPEEFQAEYEAFFKKVTQAETVAMKAELQELVNSIDVTE